MHLTVWLLILVNFSRLNNLCILVYVISNSVQWTFQVVYCRIVDFSAVNVLYMLWWYIWFQYNQRFMHFTVWMVNCSTINVFKLFTAVYSTVVQWTFYASYCCKFSCDTINVLCKLLQYIQLQYIQRLMQVIAVYLTAVQSTFYAGYCSIFRCDTINALYKLLQCIQLWYNQSFMQVTVVYSTVVQSTFYASYCSIFSNSTMNVLCELL